MARDDPQFNLRMTQELKDMIAERAKANGRSMNTEIVHMLIDGLEKELRETSELEASVLTKRHKELRNSLPKTDDELVQWKNKMLDLSFYFMSKVSSYTKNYEALKELTEEAEECVSQNKKPT